MCDADFADELIARIENRCAAKCSQPRRELVWQNAQTLQESQERRMLGARRSVLHLDRHRDSFSRYANRMHPFRADFADQPSAGLLDQNRVEAIGPAEKKRM